jgi:hypothetical protein
MSLIKVFVLAWDDSQFIHIPNDGHIIKVNLNKLKLVNNLPNENQQFSENRIFLSGLVDEYINGSDSPEFVGFVTWRWFDKFSMKKSIIEWKYGAWKSDVVYVVARIPDWYNESLTHHTGMEKYMKEMSLLTGYKLGLRNGFYFNNFVCATVFYKEFQHFLRTVITHFHAKYGYEMDYRVIPEHESRRAACLYERIAPLYFSNKCEGKKVGAIYNKPKLKMQNLI